MKIFNILKNIVYKLRNKRNGGFGDATVNDLNSLTTSGIYWINPSVTTLNKPINTYGWLTVDRGYLTDSGNIMQYFTPYRLGTTYHRLFANGQWYAWSGGITSLSAPTSVHSSYKINGGLYHRVGDIVYILIQGQVTAQITSAGSVDLVQLPYTVTNRLIEYVTIGGTSYPRCYINGNRLRQSVSSTLNANTTVDFIVIYHTTDAI